MQDRHRTAAQQIRPGLQAAADVSQVGCLAVTDGDHELPSGEHMHLAELDSLRLVDVAGRAQHAEEVSPVAVDGASGDHALDLRGSALS